MPLKISPNLKWLFADKIISFSYIWHVRRLYEETYPFDSLCGGLF